MLEMRANINRDKGFSLVPLNSLLMPNSMKVGPFGSHLSGNDFKEDGYWVYNQRVVIDQIFEENSVFIDEEKFVAMNSFQVKAGDILITTRGTIGKVCKIPETYNKGIIHPCIIKFKLNDTKYPFDMLKLLFNESEIITKQLTYFSNATTIDVIYSGILKKY